MRTPGKAVSLGVLRSVSVTPTRLAGGVRDRTARTMGPAQGSLPEHLVPFDELCQIDETDQMRWCVNSVRQARKTGWHLRQIR